jgi:hypothetical protein
MAKRKPRIEKRTPPALGICERCNLQFKSDLPHPDADIQPQFDLHKCTLTDSSQNALRIVRESTEGK